MKIKRWLHNLVNVKTSYHIWTRPPDPTSWSDMCTLLTKSGVVRPSWSWADYGECAERRWGDLAVKLYVQWQHKALTDKPHWWD